MSEFAVILSSWSTRTPEERSQVIALLHTELRGAATRAVKSEGSIDLRPAALVEQVFRRLVPTDRIGEEGRFHFYFLAGRMVREILVAEARLTSRRRDRGLGTQLTGQHLAAPLPLGDLVELDEWLAKLGEVDPVYMQLVDAQVFAGMSLDQVSRGLGLEIGVAKRKWKVALAWLQEHMSGRGLAPPSQ